MAPEGTRARHLPLRTRGAVLLALALAGGWAFVHLELDVADLVPHEGGLKIARSFFGRALSPALASSMLSVAQAQQPKVEDELLSPRQVEILQGIADGLSTKQVARELGITQKTVHNHLNAIYRRLDTQSLTHAVLSAVRLGIIDLNE